MHLDDYPSDRLDLAEKALAFILDDQPWPEGQALVPWPLILTGLRGKGFTLGEVHALTKRLVQAGVFMYRKVVKPAGASRENGYRVIRTEPKVDEFFLTTRESWRSYIANKKTLPEPAESTEVQTPAPSRGELKAIPQTVLDIIKKQPKGKGIQGKAIISKLKKKGITLEESTLRRHILPQLKLYGVINVKAAGGYLISNPGDTQE